MCVNNYDRVDPAAAYWLVYCQLATIRPSHSKMFLWLCVGKKFDIHLLDPVWIFGSTHFGMNIKNYMLCYSYHFSKFR